MAKKKKAKLKAKTIFVSLDFIKYFGISLAGLLLLSTVFYFVTIRGDVFQLFGAAITCSANKENPVLNVLNEDYDGNIVTFKIEASDTCGISRIIVEQSVFEGMNMQTAVVTTTEREYTADHVKHKTKTITYRLSDLQLRGGIVQFKIRAYDTLGNPSEEIVRNFEI